jgi:predicted acetyltransferase
VLEPVGEEARGFVVAGAGALERDVLFTQKRGTSYRYDLEVSDIAALTARAARRLLGFFSDHASMAEEIVWNGGPDDAILAHLPEPSYRVTLLHHWMLRIVHVPRALEARGYARGLAAELHLAVRDPLVRDNAGRFVLEVAGGRGSVRRGGSGRLALDVRALAPLFSGRLAPAALRVAGLLDGPPAEMEAAAAVFAGPAPSMPDMF